MSEQHELHLTGEHERSSRPLRDSRTAAPDAIYQHKPGDGLDVLLRQTQFAPLRMRRDGGQDAPQLSLQRQHAVLLGDARLSQPRYAQRRADLFLQLQQTYGNTYARQVAGLIKEQARQKPGPELSVQRCGSTPCNCSPAEKAAHAAEEEMPTQRTASSKGDETAELHAQRSASAAGEEPEEDLPAQRSASAESGEHSDVAAEIRRSQGTGQQLEPAARAKLEGAMGVDLSNVTIHADSQADTLSRSVAAEAFTTGNDVYFRAGRYDPHSEGGLHLLAHELTHTVQQSKGAVSGTQHSSGVSVSDPSDSFEQEAEATATQTMARIQHPAEAAAVSPLQRVEASEEDLQRQAAPEEEQPVQTRRTLGSPPTLQRQPGGAGPAATLTCSDFAGEPRLEACFENKGRLKPGDTGADVGKVQQAFVNLGDPDFAVDVTGVYDSKTAKAVIAFKKKEKLGFTQFPDIGPGTMHKLNDLCPQKKEPEPKKEDCPDVPEGLRDKAEAITGLKKGDGVESDSPERPRVHRLQVLLKDRTGAALEPTCTFDNKTEKILIDFQGSLGTKVEESGKVDLPTANALLGKQSPDPQPNPPPFNPQLEDTMDAVWNVLQFILLARRDGLDELAVQLRKDDFKLPEKDSDNFKDGITDGIKFGIGKLLEPLANGVAAVLTAYSSGLVTTFTEPAIEFVKGLLAPDDDSAHAKISAVELFIQAQKKIVNDHSFQVQQDFITKPSLPQGETDPDHVPHTRQQLRELERRSPGLGMKEAKADLATLDNSRSIGPKAQFDASLSGWAISLAQAQLGTKTSGEEKTEHRGTNLDKLAKDTKGVLEVPVGEQFTFFAGSPVQQTPHLLPDGKNVILQGLSGNLLKKLKEHSPTIKDMKIPFFAKGTIIWTEVDKDSLQPTKDPVEIEFRIGLNEDETVFKKVQGAEGLHYLRLKATGGKEVAQQDDALEEQGALKAIHDDVGSLSTENLNLKNDSLDL